MPMSSWLKRAAMTVAAVCAFGAMGQPLYQCEMTVGGYAGSTTLTNFPVLVRISPERIGEFSYGDCQQNGADISFTDMDGTALAHEVDTWNTDGESLVWVKVPTLSGKETKFKFRWCDSVPPANDPTAVWTEYIGVWHFNVLVDSTDITNSARNDYDLKFSASGVGSIAADAPTGKGLFCETGTVKTKDYEHEFAVGSKFTVTGWFYLPSFAGTSGKYAGIVSKKVGLDWSANTGWYLQMNQSKTTIGLVESGAAETKYASLSDVTKNWNHFALISNGSYARAYFNGSASAGINRQTVIKASSTEFQVGSAAGYFDEYRLRKGAVSTDWTSAEYATVANADYLTAGTTEILSTKAIVVSSDGAQYGEVSPAYGQITEPEDGTQYAFTCTMATQMLNVAETTRAVCTGWTLQKLADGTEIKSSASEGESPFTCSHTYVQDQGVVLKWCWQVQHKVTAEAAVGGTVSKSEEWVVSGDSFTVTATEDAANEFCFYRWADADGKMVSYDAALSLSITAPIALTAEFGGSYYVATTGSEENDGLTRETPRADLEKLVSELPDGSTVYVAEGAYDIHSKWLVLTNAIRLVGSEDPTKTKIRANPKSVSKDDKWRVLYMNNPGALVTGFTLRDGRWQGYNYGDYGPGNLRLAAGVVSNCLITAGLGSVECCGGIEQLGGLLTHSTITGNTANYGGSSWSKGYGGGVKLVGGIMEHCVITNNSCTHTGIGVYQTGGTNRFNRIAHNKNTGVSGAGVYISGGLMERCEIDHTQGSSATVNQAGGTIRNCFIHDNTVAGEGGGISMTGGTLEYCTIVNNVSQETKTGGIYLNNANAKARYNVTYLNGDASANAGCNLTVTAGTSTGNVSTDPSFTDAGSGDFTLGAGSPAIDIVTEADGVNADFTGKARPSDGDGDGTARNDAGCFEAPGANEGALRCSIAVTGAALALDSLTTSFKASVAGEGSDGELDYFWDVDGDGTVDYSGRGSAYTTCPHSYTAFGRFDVTLWVSNGNAGVSFTYPACVGVGSSTIYVNAANAANAKWPYASWETAAADINEAFSTILWVDGVAPEMIVTNGTYDVKSKWLMLTKAITLRSVEGPEKTILRARNTEADTKRRVLYVAHDGALVTGFTLREGNWQAYNWGDYGAGALRLSAGVVSNCIFTANSGHVECGGGAEVIGGLLTHSLLYANAADHGSSGGRYGRGGGIMLKGGLVEHCVISNNNCNGTGQGIYQTGGTNRFNRICKQNKSSTAGAGVMISGGLMELCEIDSNTGSASTIDQSGGTVRNCFIHDNTVTGNGGGVTMTGGTLEYCTLVNNKSTEVKACGIYLNQASGKNAVAQYCVTYLNGDVTANPSCNLSVVAGTTTAVVSTDPSFANPNAGDFTLGAGSAAIDAAEAAREDVAVDFAGNVRPKDGDGDHDAVNDCGCFEAPDASEGPMRCSLTASQTRALDSLETTFTASVGGSGSEGPVTYSWDFDGDGTFDKVGTGDEYASVTTTYSDYGYYDVILKTENGDNTAVTTNKGCIGIGTATVYVNASNAENAKWPYASWETAAADINVAYDTLIWQDGVAPEFIVTNGTYEVKSKWLMLTSAITLRSVEGPEKTILKAANPEATDKRRVLYMNHPDAWVEGFNLNAANWQGYAYGDKGAGALRLEAGVVTNCIISGSQGQVDCSGGAEIKGGLLTHTVIRGNQANQGGSSGSTSFGAGVRISGGEMCHCVVSNNYCYKYSGGTSQGGGAVYVSGSGVVRDCVIVDNYSTRQNDGCREFAGSQIYATGGLVERCIVGDMQDGRNVYSPGVYQTGGTIRNCLVKGAFSNGAAQALTQTGGSFYNNTVVTNGFGQAVNAAPVAAEVTGGEVVNCIFALNNGGDLADGSDAFVAFSRFDEAAGGSNISAAPGFKKVKAGNYQLTSGSPCKDSGDKSVWTDIESPTDLLGGPRIIDGRVDMGCYEGAASGFMMILR